jgi:hypothetical protein
MLRLLLRILLATTTLAAVMSFTSLTTIPTPRPSSLLLLVSESSSRSSSVPTSTVRVQKVAASRRAFLDLTTTLLPVALLLLPSDSANALVKGVAPPPPKTKGLSSSQSKNNGSEKPLKCTNVEDCQTMAERRDQELKEEELRDSSPPEVTKGGTRYRDIQQVSGDSSTGDEMRVQQGDQVKLYFKTLKLGKRSYDGISGEGTVVFSRGESSSRFD